MLKILLLTVALALPTIVLTGCGKTEAQKTQEVVDTGNEKLKRMDQIADELLSQGVVVQSKKGYDEDMVVSLSKPSLKRKTVDEISRIKALLNEYLSCSAVVQDSLTKKNVTFSGDATDIPRWAGNARALLRAIDNLI